MSKKNLDEARKAVHEVDSPDSPINAIVIVLMLREGWDVRNVTVVVGLRPYTAKANILPEQAIGRGLRLMFRDIGCDFTERVDIIGNQKFLDFVDDLEKLEELQLDTFEIGKDKLKIVTIIADGEIGRNTTLGCRSVPDTGPEEKSGGRDCRPRRDVFPDDPAADVRGRPAQSRHSVMRDTTSSRCRRKSSGITRFPSLRRHRRSSGIIQGGSLRR